VRIPKITVVTPCFNEQDALPHYRKSVEQVLLARTDAEYHVLLVDDGSEDGTWRLIQEACADSPRYRGLRLSRNFGSHTAATAGLDLAEGDAAAILPADLQEPPEAVIALVERWRNGADVVWGKRRAHNDGRLRGLANRVFSGFLRRFAMPRGSKFATGSFLLLDRKVLECLRQLREHNRVIFGLVAWTGFDQDVVEYDRSARVAGRSSWTLSRMIRAMYDTFIGFSNLLPRMMTITGLTCALVGFLASVVLLLSVMIAPPLVLGWSSIIIALTLFSGITFLMLGVISEYLFRIYLETTCRPLYFIARDTAEAADGRQAGLTGAGDHHGHSR
jgi:glycosyltransferase involved in cell wall biosynthesis